MRNMNHPRTLSRCAANRHPRNGGAAVITAIVILMLMGFTALAIDLGYLMLARTQLQAASDSASLAGGTELKPGLGKFATSTPMDVEAAARPVAQTFAAANRNANLPSTFVDQNRDVEFGQAVFDPGSGSFIQSLGAQPYNMVRVTVHRDQAGSSNGDEPIPLFFARALGRTESSQSVVSAAAIFPADGFVVTEPGESSGVMPFAYKEKAWRLLEQAQDWYALNGGNPSLIPASATEDVAYMGGGGPTYDYTDPNTGLDYTVSAFHQHAWDNQGDLIYDANGNPVWEQFIYDNFNASPDPNSTETQLITGTAPSAPSTASDGILEINLYPESTGGAITAGNAGTVDLGDTNNAAQAIADQIIGGLTYEDYQAMEDQGILTDGKLMLDPDSSPPVEFSAEGDTGISGGPIQQAMDQIIGETRSILLYDTVDAPGNNALYHIVEFVGVRVLYARMNTNDKCIWIQMAPHQDGTAVPDLDEVPGPDTTVFTPLILIE